jgi:hypothetical protein
MKLIFNTLKDAFEHIDNTNGNWVYNKNYSHGLKLMQEKQSDRDIKLMIQWEIDCMEFMLADGKIKPFTSWTDKEGNIIEYPSLNNYKDETYEYIEKRAEDSSNPILKARFYQILWNSPKKNRKYALKAIDAYLEFLKGINHQGVRNRDNYNLFFNAINLASDINYKIDEVIIFIQSEVAFCIDDRLSIYRGMLSLKKLKKKHFIGADEVSKLVVSQKLESKNWSGIEWSLKIAINLAKKLQQSTTIYQQQLAECYESIIGDKSLNDSEMVHIHYLSLALEIYQTLKMTEKEEEVAVRIVELRKNLKLNLISTELGEEETKLVLEYIHQTTEWYLDRPIDEFFDYLTNGINIFPSKKQLENTLKERESSFLDKIPRSFIDINNNSRKESDNESDKHKQSLYEEYGWRIDFSVGLLMDNIFRKGIQTGVLNYNTLMNQLHKRTWLGRTFEYRSGGGELEKYSWLNVIAPSIFEFFRQEEASILNQEYTPNFVMVIDSLTLKFEGVLRDFARLIGVQTIRHSEKIRGEREMYIEDILANKKIQEYFDENDIMLFKYIFLIDGINLRNNIAHCFFKYNDYRKLHIYLLIAAFLRIGKYNIKD